MRRIPATICVLAMASAVWAEDAQWRPAGEHVLVVYSAGNADDVAAAEYYALRRGVPKANLLGLKLDAKVRRWNYKQFFEQILTPAAKRLEGEKGADISYLVTCPGLPLTIDTGHRPPKEEAKRRNWFVRTGRRSTDQFLICIEANQAAGVGTGTSINRKTGKATRIPAAGPGRAGILGAHMRELVLPLYGQYARAATAMHVRQLRKEDPDRMGFRLVSRVGLTLDSARDSVDRALYAERFLRLPGKDDPTPFRPEIWLDMKYQFAQDHVSAMKIVVPMVRGATGSPFNAKSGLLMPWPLVIDNVPTEIGAGNPAHRPQVTATISSVEDDGVTLTPPRKSTRAQPDAPAAYYFIKGWKLTTYTPKPRKPATTQPAAPTDDKPRPVATITGLDLEKNRLLLSSTKGFAGGDKVRSEWPGTFPADNCVLFYGFYGLGQFEDCRKFPPGAMGVHVDSSCLRWARGAINRGITTTWGVVTEPLSAGIPYGHLLLAGLTQGYDWAESTYAATRLSQRWAGVCLGDPLYAPFRSLERVDKTAPVIGPLTTEAGKKRTIVTARLAGESEDELVDVALFKLEYGPTKAYGKTIAFFDWPDPADGKNVKGRRFGYSRHFKATLADLPKGKPVHYRLTARDPAGLKTSKTGTFTP